jgi:hypothetical protein
MNERIKELAEQAFLKANDGSINNVRIPKKFIELFAELIRADEREACAKVCVDTYTGEESCGDWPTPEMCAAAIRARGNE